MSQLLKILGLGLGASEMEIKVHYQQLVRKSELTAAEASDFF
jgi:hypothetical protein